MLRTTVLSRGNEKPRSVMIALVISCWVVLAVWGASPYSSYLHHESLAKATLFEVPLLTSIFSIGWILMVGAMMIPAEFPILLELSRATHKVSQARVKVSLFMSGYIALWLLVGVSLFFSDFWLHRTVEASPFLARNSFLIPTAALGVCGFYQLTKFKHRVLARCRQPLNSIQAECLLECNTERNTFRFGLRHGYLSVGMCGTFMLLMFAADLGTLWSMMLLGGVMLMERYATAVDKLADRLGFGLIGTAVAYVLVALIHM